MDYFERVSNAVEQYERIFLLNLVWNAQIYCLTRKKLVAFLLSYNVVCESYVRIN